MATTTPTGNANDASPTLQFEANPRWIRGKVGGVTVVDSRNSTFVWEVPYYPQWYFPPGDINAELRPTGRTSESETLGTATVFDLAISDGDGASPTVLEGAARMYEQAPAEQVRDLVRISWDAVETWLEEEVVVTVHPRSPYTRVDVLPSARAITVTVDGTVVAHSTRPYILYETGLPARYYLPPSDVRTELLTATESTSACPYKGVARYWSVTVDGVTHEDLVWGYDDPLPESALVKDLMCFYNEKVDLEIDGVPLERPTTKFS